MQWPSAPTIEILDADQKKAFERALTKLELSPEDAPAWLLKLALSPELLKDSYMNLSSHVLKAGALSLKQKLVLATTVAHHAGAADVAHYFATRAITEGATEKELYEAAGIAATSTSYNYYYKFRSLYEGDAFEGFTPGLRASLFVNSSCGKGFAELINILISSINGCKSCVNGHVNDAISNGISKEMIDEGLRLSGIIMAIATFSR